MGSQNQFSFGQHRVTREISVKFYLRIPVRGTLYAVSASNVHRGLRLTPCLTDGLQFPEKITIALNFGQGSVTPGGDRGRTSEDKRAVAVTSGMTEMMVGREKLRRPPTPGCKGALLARFCPVSDQG